MPSNFNCENSIVDLIDSFKINIAPPLDKIIVSPLSAYSRLLSKLSKFSLNDVSIIFIYFKSTKHKPAPCNVAELL